jgi:similar to stage IV sporulation protein
VAVVSGIVTEVKLAAGQPLVEPGKTVAEGDVLISGFMDLPEYTLSEVDMGQYVVHADGEVIARTWRTLKSTIPLSVKLKNYTGEGRSLWAVNFLGQRLNFYQNSGISYERYDKITETKQFAFPGGGNYPVSLTKERVMEYTLEDGTLDRDAAIDYLEDGLRQELDEILTETGGTCVRQDYIATVEGDLLTVTLLAECVEQIGTTVEREGKVGFIPPNRGSATS